ncbi:AEC family transporter [Liquorilactobacillus oeni]|uniref:Malate permease n=1 Tax=Liquorilactobacillus oeni DSM 19972 TaxID=1423777 RepID=A0A0R1M9S7_9LACO|nr:AEC family transporter [Liquorilactobacillus oeni]KRL04895.1 malate permease [Liquorilactobacillus oeni DSM 19972]
MEVFEHSVSGVLVILIMIILGYILAEKGWFDQKSKKLIARIVTQISLPCYMMVTITDRFTAQDLAKMLPDLRFPVISMLILMALAFAIVQVFRIRNSHAGLFSSMFFNSNTVFVGLPINQALFGSSSVPYVLIYYMANTTIFWTLGTYLIQRDGTVETKMSLKKTLSKVFSPPLLGFIIGVIFVLLKIKLPIFVSSDLSYIGSLTIPLSMIFIGISVSHAGLKNITFKKDNLLVLLGRFVFAPALMIALVMPSDMPLLMKQVFILQSAMPVMTNAPVVASLYGADSDYAAVMVTETTLISLIMVPILMVITQSL